MIRGAIFDLDGTLVDSNEAHVLSWVETLAEFGWKVAPEQVRPLIGMGGDKLLPALIGVAEDSPQGRPIRRRRQRLMQHLTPELRPFPGSQALLQRLGARGLRRAVASSANHDDVARLLDITGLTGYFEAVISADDADRSKPDPDILDAARRKLGLEPGEVILIGDTRHDIAAARRLGIAVIGLRCGGATDEALAGAAAIYEDPADLLAHLEDSPLAAPRE